MSIYELPKEHIFPPPSEAEPDGLLAIGGDLHPRRLLYAYALGIFPWYNQDDPIMWWSPNPRLIIYPDKFKVSKSLKQKIKRQTFQIRIDFAFEEVIKSCAKVVRKNQQGTWINDDIITAYVKLFNMGLAHSVECWLGNKLVGGLYGISLGSAFFGESMFHKYTDASKVAFYYLTQIAKQLKFDFIDCQVSNPHLISLGAEGIDRDLFLDKLSQAMQNKTIQGNWEKLCSV